jgi:F-type H+-transporting ATPase subunit delta
MSAEKISIRYAQSLFDLAESKGSIETVKNDVLLILDAINGSKELQMALQSPIIKADKKQAFMKAIFGSKIQELTLLMMNLLVTKGREKYTKEVCESFMGLYNVKNNIVPVKLRTAVAVSDQVKKEITSNIKGIVQIESIIDPSLIGGFVVEYNNQMYDASVSRSLEVLKQKFQ